MSNYSRALKEYLGTKCRAMTNASPASAVPTVEVYAGQPRKTPQADTASVACEGGEVTTAAAAPAATGTAQSGKMASLSLARAYIGREEPSHTLYKGDNLATKLSPIETIPGTNLPTGELSPSVASPRDTLGHELLGISRGFSYVTDEGCARDWLKKVSACSGAVGLDLETVGDINRNPRIRLVSLAAPELPVVVLDLFHLPISIFQEAASSIAFVAHNALFEIKTLRQAGVRVRPDCTMLAWHVLSGDKVSLSKLAQIIFGASLDKSFQQSDWSGELTPAQLRYAAHDAEVALRLWGRLEPRLKEEGSHKAYKAAMDAQTAVARMELSGMPFDAFSHAELTGRIETEAENLRNSLVGRLPPGTLSSSVKLGAWLSDAVPLKSRRKLVKTKTGKIAVSETALRKAQPLLSSDRHKVLNLILEYKAASKLSSTYGKKFAAQCIGGRIRTTYWLAGTASGRLSSSGPNLQNIPREKRFRELFRVVEGRKLIVADYSQIELRVAAEIAGERVLLDGYANGLDVHSQTASSILGKDIATVTKEERNMAKAVNFGLLYGMSANSLADYASGNFNVQLSPEDAEKWRQGWLRIFSSIASWQNSQRKTAWDALEVRTPLGRPRRFNCRYAHANDKPFRETVVYNHPIQGGAAEVLLLAMANLDRALDCSGVDAEMVGTVHDEILVESSEESAVAVKDIVERSMRSGMRAVFPSAPLDGLVDAKIVSNWSEKG